MKKYIFLFFLIPLFLIAQNKRDYNWLFGYPPNNPESLFGGSWLNFHQNPIEVSYFEIPVFFVAIGNISDEEGNLLFYSNGCQIINSKHELMENGDSLNYGEAFEIYCDRGYPSVQGISIVPRPEKNNEYILFSVRHASTFILTDLLFTAIDMDMNEGSGQVISKNNLILEDELAGQLTAVRHGNGRDWWIFVPQQATNGYFRFLLTPDEIKGPFFQQKGAVWRFNDYSGQATFSPDGTKYIRINPANGLHIFDFDRCSGLLDNPIHIPFPNDTIGAGGVAVSPNSRYLYATTGGINLFQFDLQASSIEDSKQLIAQYDGFTAPFPTTFFQQMLAPDGKIYMTATNGVHVLHVIHNPNEPGQACNFEQHGIMLASHHGFSVPNFPHFRLYDMPDSPCDTLGIDDPARIDDPAILCGINLYPNPTAGQLWIKSGIGQPLTGIFQLYTVTGQFVMETNLESERKKELQLNDLATGVYFYRWKKEGTTLQSGKIIKQ